MSPKWTEFSAITRSTSSLRNAKYRSDRKLFSLCKNMHNFHCSHTKSVIQSIYFPWIGKLFYTINQLNRNKMLTSWKRCLSSTVSIFVNCLIRFSWNQKFSQTSHKFRSLGGYLNKCLGDLVVRTSGQCVNFSCSCTRDNSMKHPSCNTLSKCWTYYHVKSYI